MLGPFTFTFTLESEEFEKSEKVALDLYQTMITTRAPDGAKKNTNRLTTFCISEAELPQTLRKLEANGL